MTDSLVLNIRLTADAGDMVGEVRVGRTELDKLTATTKETERATDGLNRRQREQSAVTRALRADLFTLRNAIGSLGVGLLVRDVGQAAMRMEQYRQTLRFATGSTQAGADAMRFLRGESDRLGLSLRDLIPGYSALTAAARGTRLEGEAVRKVFTAVAEASRVMGLSAAEADGAIRALQQMISKGKVSAEELSGQLGERMPGAFQMAARAMNVTTAELSDMLQKGQVLAEDLLPRLAEEMQRSFAASVPDAARTAAAEFARLENATLDLKVAIGEELLPTFTDFVRWLTETGIPTISFALDRMNVLDRSISSMTAGEAALEIERVSQKIEGRVAASRGTSDPVYLRRLSEEIADLNARRQQLQMVVARAQTDAIERFGPRRAERAERDRANAGGGGNTAGAAALEDAAELEAKLREQIALFNDTGKAAELRYQIEHGALQALEPERQKTLLALAGELDALERAKAAGQAKAKADAEGAREAERAAKQGAERAKREREALADGVEALRQSTRTEVELEEERHRAALDLLERAEEEKLDTIGSYQELRERLEKQHAGNLAEIQKKGQAEALREQERLAERQRELVEQPFKNALTGIQGAFTDAFEQILSGGVKTFGDLADQVKRVMIRMAAEVAALMVFRPVAAGFLQAAGMGSLAGSLGLGGLSGGAGGLGTVASGASLLSSMVGGFQSSTLGNFGASLGARMGLGASGQAFLGNAGLNAPFAVLGGLGARMLGLGGGMASTVLGSAGGLLGGGIGAGLTALGSFGGPIGAIAGSFLGSALGGLFGGGVSRQAAGVQYRFGQGVIASGGKNASPDQAAGIAGQLASSIEQLAAAIGGRVVGGFSVGTQANASETGESPFTLQGRDYASAEELLRRGPMQLLTGGVAIRGIDYRLQPVLQRSARRSGSIEEVLSDLQFAQKVLGLGTGEAVQAIRSITKEFDAMRERAQGLGLSLAAINRAEVSDLRAMRGQIAGGLVQQVEQARGLLGLDQLRGLRDAMNVGALSPRSLPDQLTTARENLDRLGASALAGDLQAARDFAPAAQQVLQLGRSVFASGPGYADLFRQVNAQLGAVIGRQEGIERSLAGDLVVAVRDASAEQIRAIREQTKELRAALAEVNRALRLRGAA